VVVEVLRHPEDGLGVLAGGGLVVRYGAEVKAVSSCGLHRDVIMEE
jgi:hypothetical protein